MAAQKKPSRKSHEPTIENRRARRDYFIEETLECGMKLTGTEIKSIRAGQASLAEAYARATDRPLAFALHGVHIAEYPPAGEHRQHAPTRVRALLASRREIRKLTTKVTQRGLTIVPLQLYFNRRGIAKVELALARGKALHDRRQDLKRKTQERDMKAAMKRR